VHRKHAKALPVYPRLSYSRPWDRKASRRAPDHLSQAAFLALPGRLSLAYEPCWYAVPDKGNWTGDGNTRARRIAVNISGGSAASKAIGRFDRKAFLYARAIKRRRRG
jgi:hypothetical protein